VVAVNATSTGKFSRIDELYYFLSEMALRSPHLPRVIPKSYQGLKVQLESLTATGVYWISSSLFMKKLLEVGGQMDDADDALDVLQDMGVILHFRGTTIPRVVLKQTWLFDVLTSVRIHDFL
jgi:hypothetical protein